MKTIAVLITCFNRKEKTIACLDSLSSTSRAFTDIFQIEVFLTNDGCTDGTVDAIQKRNYRIPIHIQNGDGSLFWNGGMICAWKAALDNGNYDGYLWLNDDTTILPDFWRDLAFADEESVNRFGRKGIYVGSTRDMSTKKFTYGGFNYVNKWTLKDEFLKPDGIHFQECQCAHGNITYISKEVVDQMGIFYDKYIHGGGDHDYTYRAHKKGFPILVLPHYAGECENDHLNKKTDVTLSMSLKERWKYVHSPLGFNLHNTLLFQRRCFPYRYPFTFCMGYFRVLFPKLYLWIYNTIRK